MSSFLPSRSTDRVISFSAERWMEVARSSQPANARPPKAVTLSPIWMPALSAGKPTIMLPMTGSFEDSGMPLPQMRPVYRAKART